MVTQIYKEYNIKKTMNIKTIPLKDKTIEGLAKKIQDFQNSNNLVSKGSLPFYNSNSQEFSVIMFFPEGQTEIIIPKKEEKKTYDKNFQPTEEQKDRWKTFKPSKKTLALLKIKGFSDEDLTTIKTQYDCHIILNNLRPENI